MPDRLASLPLLPTTVIGSHPQPAWLFDREGLGGHVPRARASQYWRVAPEQRREAEDDATILAVRDMEQAGIDIITDGEMRRESYSNHFIGALDGIDMDRPGVLTMGGGRTIEVPRVVSRVQRRGDVEVEALRFVRALTDKVLKVTLPGPFTMAQQAQDDFYGDPEALATDLAEAVNAEARALEAAGADVVQIDEPWVRNNPDGARGYAVKVIDRALQGLTCGKVVHLCFGYAAAVRSDKPNRYKFLTELSDSSADDISIEAAQPNLDLGVLAEMGSKRVILGVINLDQAEGEPSAVVEARIEAALRYLGPERLIPAPDCGMKYLSREAARTNLRSLVGAAANVRARLGA